MPWTLLTHYFLEFFLCLLKRFIVFRISNPLSNFIAIAFLSNTFLNFCSPPSGFFIKMSYFFGPSKHLFYNLFNTINHMVPHNIVSPSKFHSLSLITLCLNIVSLLPLFPYLIFKHLLFTIHFVLLLKETSKTTIRYRAVRLSPRITLWSLQASRSCFLTRKTSILLLLVPLLW